MKLQSEIMDPVANNAVCSHRKETEMAGVPDCRDSTLLILLQLLHILLQGKCVKCRGS